MGVNQSKSSANNEIQLQEQANKSIGSLGSAVELPSTPTFSVSYIAQHIRQTIVFTVSSLQPFQRLRNLSFNNRYEKFPANSSLNNLAGNLTPSKTTSPPNLKQRLIKALGGYNLLDPRSPSQIFARTPLSFKKSAEYQQKNAEADLCSVNRILETSLDTSHLEDETEGHNPYDVLEEQLDNNPEEAVAAEEENAADCSGNDKDSVNFNDPRSPTEGIHRTPLTIPATMANDETPKTSHEVVSQKTKPKQEKETQPQAQQSQPQKLIKTMYKDLVRRETVYTDLLLDDDDWTDVGKSTPVKAKPAATTKIYVVPEGERTPLGCIVNKTRNLNFNSTPIKGANIQIIHDNFIDSDENTPVESQISRQIVVSSAVAGKSVSSAASTKTRIPLRARRVE